MKDWKDQTRPGNRVPIHSVSLQIRDYQVTMKVKSTVPQVRNSAAAAVRTSFR
jgi:hypothetical protein